MEAIEVSGKIVPVGLGVCVVIGFSNILYMEDSQRLRRIERRVGDQLELGKGGGVNFIFNGATVKVDLELISQFVNGRFKFKNPN